MKILELEENTKIVWECIESDKEWVGTKVYFELFERNNKTAVVLKHANWRAISEYYKWCNYNWAMFLQRLANYCEHHSINQ